MQSTVLEDWSGLQLEIILLLNYVCAIDLICKRSRTLYIYTEMNPHIPARASVRVRQRRWRQTVPPGLKEQLPYLHSHTGPMNILAGRGETDTAPLRLSINTLCIGGLRSKNTTLYF